MNLLKGLLTLIISFVLLTTSHAQIPNAKTQKVKVYGNCGMCEKLIEKAAFKEGEAKADWNKDTKMAVITFDTKKTTLDEVLKRIATVGYDNQNYRANDSVYNNLHGCCQYDRPKKK